jgi:hypothetical protein
MNDSVLIWEKYTSLHEANLISKDPLHLELENILKEKNVQNSQIKDWFLKTYIKWFQSPADDNQKIGFISPYQAKDTDPEWAKKEGIYQFNQFAPEYKDRLLHLIDFLETKDENYLKSLFKVTVPQMFEEVQKWDQEMERSSEKAEKAKLESVDGVDYEVVGVYEGYPVWKLISNKAFREESMYMGHCVGQAAGETKVTRIEGGESRYFKRYKEGELLIYSLRDPKKHNHPSVTFELNKVYGEKKFHIVQIKGPANREVSERYRKACRKFIEDQNFTVVSDGKNIGMLEWKGKFYHEDTKEFKKLYELEIIPFQEARFSYYASKIKNGFIDSDINISNMLIKKLPDFSNITCTGKFSCEDNLLTTLEGAPKKVIGTFDCRKNKLTNLRGAPAEIVYGSFDCSDNQLTSLEGAPQNTYGGFLCRKNRLTSLEGSPKKVGGTFDCSYNKLTTLEGAPHEVNGTFDCSYNKLTTLEGAPQIVLMFDSNYNPVKFTDVDIIEAMEKSKQRNSTKLESFKTFFTESRNKNKNNKP